MADAPSLEEIAKLTSQLSPQEQLKLVARIGERLSAAYPRGDEVPPGPQGSPSAVLKAAKAPPHVQKDDVDALEQAIVQGSLPIKEVGAFDEPQGG